MQVTKIFTFAAAHRLFGYVGPCANVHGHTYKLEVTLDGDMNELGIVIDFKTIKSIVGTWIEDKWDHALLLNSHDEMVGLLSSIGVKYHIMFDNPTAENMISVFVDEMREKFRPHFVKLVRVRLWETDTSYAEITL